jgi:hypothetical protein
MTTLLFELFFYKFDFCFRILLVIVLAFKANVNNEQAS